MNTFAPAGSGRRAAIFEVVFDSRTPEGRAFDIALIAAILLSVGVVILASVPAVRASHGDLLYALEWLFTGLFTVEYLVRLAVVARPRTYARSFFGVVDLLAILPTYLSVLVPGAEVLLVIRIVRILRVFHVLELSRHVGAAGFLLASLRAARYPITVFFLALAATVVFVGTLMYAVEGEGAGITSIPTGIYWAIVTLTTLGYGDIVPVTSLGRALTAGIVVLGYWVIAVPVGIIVTELAETARKRRERRRAAKGTAPAEGQSAREGAGQADRRSAQEAEGTAPAEGQSAQDGGAAPAEGYSAPEDPEEGVADGNGSAEAGEAACARCGAGGHAEDARYCRRCGGVLNRSRTRER